MLGINHIKNWFGIGIYDVYQLLIVGLIISLDIALWNMLSLSVYLGIIEYIPLYWAFVRI